MGTTSIFIFLGVVYAAVMIITLVMKKEESNHGKPTMLTLNIIMPPRLPKYTITDYSVITQ